MYIIGNQSFNILNNYESSPFFLHYFCSFFVQIINRTQVVNVGENSFAVGSRTKASNMYSAAFGFGTSATGKSSVVFGEYGRVSGLRSAGFGHSVQVSGDNAAGFGVHTIAESYGEVVVGTFNVTNAEDNSNRLYSSNSWEENDPLFVIGNGTSKRERSNAVTVLKNGRVGIGTYSPKSKLDVSGNVRAVNFINVSDKRFKKSIETLGKEVEGLSNLRGVSYEMEKDVSEDERRQYGFIAQELREVYPDLVHEDDNGYLSVNYIGLIPLLVEANKKTEARLKELELKLATKSNERSGDALKIKSKLYQNRPNPFTESTKIEFELSSKVESAILYIYDMTGQQVRSEVIEERGKSTLTIEGRELKAGMYLYSLIVDGEEVDTKRMILTR